MPRTTIFTLLVGAALLLIINALDNNGKDTLQQTFTKLISNQVIDISSSDQSKTFTPYSPLSNAGSSDGMQSGMQSGGHSTLR